MKKPTTEDIKAELPGPRKDAWVAEFIFNWSIRTFPAFEGCDGIVWQNQDKQDVWQGPPKYTTDISAAWEVLTKLSKHSHFVAFNIAHKAIRKIKREVRITMLIPGHGLKDYVGKMEEREKLPDAICTVALLACLEHD